MLKKIVFILLTVSLLVIGIYLAKSHFTGSSSPILKTPSTPMSLESPCSKEGCPPYEPPTLERHSPPAPVLTSPEEPTECPYTVTEPTNVPAKEEKEVQEPVSPTFEATEMEPDLQSEPPEEPIPDKELNTPVGTKVPPEDEPDAKEGENSQSGRQSEEEPAANVYVEPEDEEAPEQKSKPPKKEEVSAPLASEPTTPQRPKLRRLGHPISE